MSFGAAVTQIIVADVSMSLDNVLAVAGAAKGEPLVLVVGLGIAIVLMAVAANAIADLLVALLLDRLDRPGPSSSMWRSSMIFDGSREVACAAWVASGARRNVALLRNCLGCRGARMPLTMRHTARICELVTMVAETAPSPPPARHAATMKSV